MQGASHARLGLIFHDILRSEHVYSHLPYQVRVEPARIEGKGESLRGLREGQPLPDLNFHVFLLVYYGLVIMVGG